MDTVLIGCGTLEDEIRKVTAKLDNPPKLIFLEASLHSIPTPQMHEMLQKELNAVSAETRVVLFSYGLCGGSINGLVTRNFKIIVPRVDDCIPLCLGSNERVKQVSQIPSFYLTGGWIKFSNKVFYERLSHYGEKRTAKIYKMLLANYKRFLFIDTGAYDLEQAKKDWEHRIKLQELPVDVVPGNISWLEELVAGPWPEEKFLSVLPNSKVCIENIDVENAISKSL